MLGALVIDAPEVIDRPLGLFAGAGQAQHPSISVRRADEILARALEIGQRGKRFGAVGMLGDDALEALARLVGFAEGVEQECDVNVGVDPHRARLRRLVIDLDRRFILLEPAIGFAERIQRQHMIGLKREGEAQKDDGGDFVALPGARRAETVSAQSVEHLRAAAVGVLDHGLQLLAGVQFGQGRLNHRMARLDLVESLINGLGFVGLAQLREIAGVGVDKAERGLVVGIGRGKAFVGLFRPAGDAQHQASVKVAEDGERRLVQRIDLSQRLLDVAGTYLAPGAQQDGGEVALLAGDAGAQFLTSGGVALELEVAHAERQSRRTVMRVAR